MADKTTELSLLSYTNRDFSSIFQNLIDLIPSISEKWTSNNESDPGIVLVKLMSMLGDMLSYNQDMAALEVFPDSVTQRKNAAQIFRLIGYKMHWYRSAKCNITAVNNSSVPATIPMYTVFKTSDDKISYTNIEQIELPASSYYTSDNITFELIQGTPVTPGLSNSNRLPLNVNEPWHSVYSYNVSSSDIKDNRLYLGYSNVDESSIVLIDDDENGYLSYSTTGIKYSEWKLVDNIYTYSEVGKIFELCIDENDRPYLLFPDYWNTKFKISKFKLFLILSDGENGEITNDVITNISNGVVGYTNDNEITNISSNIILSNTVSTYGYSPQTPDEARKDSSNYVNTLDTLVTLDDFTRAGSRVEGVAKCIAKDHTNDPGLAYDYITDLNKYSCRLYIVRKPGYSTLNEFGMYDEGSDDVYKLQVKTELQKHKHIVEDVDVQLDDSINFSYWTVKGTVYTREPITIEKSHDLIVKINNILEYNYSPDKIEFNETIKYMDVIDKILSCDNNIKHVDLKPIEYRQINQSANTIDKVWVKVPSSEVSAVYSQVVSPNADKNNKEYDIQLGAYKYKFDTDDEENRSLSNSEEYKYYSKRFEPIEEESLLPKDEDGNVINSLVCPIQKGTLTITLSNGMMVLYDDGQGNILDNHGIIDTGKIDYKRGIVSFRLIKDYNVESDFIIRFKKNSVNMAKYESLSPLEFTVASECIKQR